MQYLSIYPEQTSQCGKNNPSMPKYVNGMDRSTAVMGLQATAVQNLILAISGTLRRRTLLYCLIGP